jgi:hypothetical protein
MMMTSAFGCSSSGDAGEDSEAQCKHTVTRALDYSECASDNDCFSGYCCKPGVFGCGHQGTFAGFCAHPNTSAFNAGHGYSCETNQDCVDIAPHLVAQGVEIACHKDHINNVSNGCSFQCKYR